MIDDLSKGEGPDRRRHYHRQGEIQRRREVMHTVSLHEIDVKSSQSYVLRSISRSRNCERTARPKSLILFIDEVHMLKCFSFLNRALENELALLVIMASNLDMAHIRRTTFRSPHRLPVDLLDDAVMVSTEP
ncbi:putative ATP-dependent DNA helicase [Armillaria fumosa]|nr:putative ATP-dependent DNA helicase [Armillaria fumosa]